MRTKMLALILITALCKEGMAQTKTVLKHDIYKDLYLNTSLYRDIDFERSYLTTVNMGMSFYPHDRFAIGPDVSIYRFWNPQYSSLGIGIGPAIRSYPVRRNKFALYVEWKGAVVFMFPEYSKQSLNYTFSSTIGSDIAVSKSLYLRTAMGYHHFSNARYYDYNYNSASDALGGYAGIVYKLK